MMFKQFYFFTVLIFLFSLKGYSQSGTCSGAEVFCGSDIYSFPTSVGTTAETGPCYSCLGSEPNPAWYFMQVGSSGNLVITLFGMKTMEPVDSLDIDFCCWGPFTSPTGACVAGLTCDKVVDCSYSGHSFETCVIPNAIAGQFYMLILTNYSNQPGIITFQQSNYGQPGSGTTNCTIVEDCSLLALSPSPTACNPVTTTYNLYGVAEFTNPPTTGNLIIKDVTASPPVQITLTPPFTSPLNYLIPNIPCDGLVHDLYSYFTESINQCEFSTTYQSPAIPCPAGVMSGDTILCENGSSVATIRINVTGAAGPFNFVYAFNGVNQPPVINYSGSLPYTFTTSDPGIYSLVSTSNNNCTGTSSGTATVSLMPLPSPPQSTNILYYTCGTGTVSLSVIANPGTQVNWYSSPTGGTRLFTGNPFTTPVIAVTTTYYAESQTIIAGCTSTSRIPVIAEVRPIPTVSNTNTSLTICSDATWNIPLFSVPANAEFFWTASCAPPGIVTGFSDTGFGNSLGETLQNPNTISGTVTYDVFPVLNQCAGPVKSFDITVNPEPVPSFTVSTSTVCAGAINIVYSTQPGMTNYQWNISAGGTIDAGGTTNSVLVSWNLSGTGTDRWIEVSYTDANGCTANNPTRLYVTVNPVPNIIITPLLQTICNGQTANVQFQSTIPGTTSNTSFTWSLTAPPSITPAPLSGNGNVSQAFSNSGVIPQNIAFTVTASALGCTSQSIGNLVTVNPKPSVIFPTSPANPQQICSGTTSVSVNLQSSVTLPGVTYSWNAVAYDPVNPTSAILGFTTPNSGNTIPGENITSALVIPGLIKYSVTPTFTSGLACSGDIAEYQVIVNPSPTVTLTPSDPTGQTICSGSSSQMVTFTPNATPITYTWQSVDMTGIAGAVTSGVTDFIPSQTLVTTGVAQGHIKYKVIPTFQGSGTFTCPGGVSYTTIYVNPLPAPVITGPSPVCELQQDVIYSTPAMTGNSYSWTISGAGTILNPATNQVTVTWGPYTSSPGTLFVTETINATGCQQTSAIKSVILQQRPIPGLTGPVNFLCEGTGNHIYQTEKNMNNYIWTVNGGIITSGGGTGNDFVIVSWNNPGLKSVEVNYTNSLQCTGFPSKILSLTVHSLPLSDISEGTGPNCESALHEYSVPLDTACTYTWSISPSSRGVITAGQGTNTITVRWSAPGTTNLSVIALNRNTTCTSSSGLQIDVHPKPTVTFTPCFDIVTTPGAKKITLKGGNPYLSGQGVYSGNRVSFNSMTGNFEFDPTGASAGNYPVTYSFNNNYGCSGNTPTITISVRNNSFSCGGEYTDPRDGKKYSTGMLSGKCWLTKNLDYGTIVNTSPVVPQTDNCISEKYCSPLDPNCTTLGGLYQWDEIMDYQNFAGSKGLCPPEWHIPTQNEWQILIDNLVNGISSPQANAVVSPELKDQNLPTGFRAQMGGLFYMNNHWAFTSGNLTSAMFWTSTPGDSHHASARGLNNYTNSISFYQAARGNAFPVRCIKD